MLRAKSTPCATSGVPAPGKSQYSGARTATMGLKWSPSTLGVGSNRMVVAGVSNRL